MTGKKFFFFIIGLLLMVTGVYSQAKVESPSTFRPWVWWFWMGNIVNQKNVDEHLEFYHRSGFGGVNIIATYGVKGFENRQITYRSSQWYNMVAYTIKQAGKLGMGVDMAFASAWPFGGASVTPGSGAMRLKECSRFDAEGLVTKRLIDPSSKDRIICVTAQLFNGESLDLTDSVKDGILSAHLPEGKWQISVIMGCATGQQVKRPSPGGEGLVLDHFSRTALDEYLSGFENELPKLKGLRSGFDDSYEVYAADYTPLVLDEFAKRRGYQPQPYMYLLFDTVHTELRTRLLCDYRTTIGEMYLENFLENWTNWSHRHGLVTTGQAHGAPGNTLDNYAAADIPQVESFGPSCFDIPGVRTDADTRREPYKRPDKLFMKFGSSAGNITGKKLISAETGTWLTNHFRMALSQIKPQVDELFVAGINHIMLISSTNVPADVPYPGWVFYPAPDFGPRAAFAPYLPDFSAYVARSQQILQESTPDNEILLYYPVYDYYSGTPSDLGVLTMMDHITTKWGGDQPFSQVAARLWQAGYSFDYISDRQLQQLETIGNTVKTTAGTTYKAIVIPQCNRIPVETMRKILALAQRGVSVYFDGKMPEDVPGLADLEKRLMQLQYLKHEILQLPNVTVARDLVATLGQSPLIQEDFNRHGLEYIRKNYKDGKAWFVFNGKNDFHSGKIRIHPHGKQIIIFNPLTGKYHVPQIETRNGETYLRLELLPGESVFILSGNTQHSAAPMPYFQDQPVEKPGLEWSITFAKGEPYTPSPLKATQLESWTEQGDSTYLYYTGTAVYRTSFDLPESLAGAAYIRIRLPEVRDMAEIRLNGKTVGRTWCVPYYVDIDRKLFKSGKNSLEIRVSNIATNRIIWMDRKKIDWKNFYIADPKKRIFDASEWTPEPAGLIGDIEFIGENQK